MPYNREFFLILQIALQRPASLRVFHFLKRLGLNLPDTLTCDMEHVSDFLQCAGPSIFQSKPQNDNFPLSFLQITKYLI